MKLLSCSDFIVRNRPANLPSAVTCVSADLTRYDEQWASVLKQCYAVIHLAGTHFDSAIFF